MIDIKYHPHVIILPSYCPVAICPTRDIAESLAEKYGYKSCTIRPVEKQDIDAIMDGFLGYELCRQD